MTDKETEFRLVQCRKFHARLLESLIIEHITLRAESARSAEPVPFAERLGLRYSPAAEGDKWGDAWDSAWFHLTGSVPESWAGDEAVVQLDFSGEALIFGEDGVPLQGLCGGSVFDTSFRRDLFTVANPVRGGETVSLWVEAAANHLSGVNQEYDPPRNRPDRFGGFPATVKKIRLCRFDRESWHLALDFEVCLQLLEYLPPGSVRHARILKALRLAMDAHRGDRANTAAARAAVRAALDVPASASDLAVVCVGHAHIDTAWLWPVRETIRKCARTFANQISLLEKYPDYVFGASAPQHYAFVKERYPEIYAEIKALAAEGRWELQGAMWVEADCNVIGGESMIRQLLHGKNFFMDEFGVDVRNLWLPDVFGYSAAMPQILLKSGVDFFLTQKLSWNQFNQFPHHSFRWRGIDGSEVLTHFPPENNYNCVMSAKSLAEGRDRFQERDTVDEFMSLFGIGDGGGGPIEEQIERGLRLRDAEGCPKVRFGRSQDFFDRMNAIKDQFQTWSGELYLEIHRGTLTTQAAVKKMNRELEFKLQALELLWSFLPLDSYPAGQIEEMWKTLLINQFHDIIPGSSINQVYRDTHRDYGHLAAAAAELTDLAGEMLLDHDHAAASFFNPLSWPRTAIVKLPRDWDSAVSADGGPVACQRGSDGVTARIGIPAFGFTTLRRSGEPAPAAAGPGPLVLENSLVRYEFNPHGQVVRGFDKEAGFEFISPAAPANVLALYHDRPNNWDAWDLDISYETQLTATAIGAAESAESGPLSSSIGFKLSVGEAAIAQRAVLCANSKRLEFRTTVDWNERHRVLRVNFPVNVAAAEASFDIQYGFVKRPTHRNTSWEMAKFEVPAHKYADLSDQDYGVALLNDCKYGHKVLDNELSLTILRSPTHPDPDADIGRHELTYAILPHPGGLIESSVIAESAELNRPPLFFADSAAPEGVTPPCALYGDGIAVEVIKKAEKENCLVIRLVELYGRRSSGVLSMESAVKFVETDMLEWKNGAEHSGPELEMKMTPFEIRTYKVFFK